MVFSKLVQHRPIASAALAIVITHWCMSLVRRVVSQKVKSVPSAHGRKPIVGHLFEYLKHAKVNSQLALTYLSLEEQRSGKPTFHLDIFGANICMTSDIEVVEEILTNDPSRFSKDFEKLAIMRFTIEQFGNGLFFATTDSEAWLIPHKVLKGAFSTGGVRTLMPMMNEQADALVQCLKREVGYGGVCPNIDHWVTKMAFETIAVCATGTSFGSFDDDQDSAFIKALNGILFGFQPLLKIPVPLWPIFGRKHIAKIRADGKIVRDTCLDIIRKRRSHETQSVSSKRDIMDIMLHDKEPKSGKSLTEEQIVDNCLTFLFAGQDSTAAAMSTLLCYLNANPACKAKLVQEISDVVGMGQLEWNHLSQLHYLDWCIKECLRLCPPAASISRTAKGSQSLQGKWDVQDGTLCLVDIMGLHYDEKIWGEDAKEFRPERWEFPPPHKYAFVPFAVGPRACIGREFTVVEQKITMVKLLQNFDFRRPENVTAEPGYTTVPAEDMHRPPFTALNGVGCETKVVSAFVGLFSAFQLFEPNTGSLCSKC